MRFSRTGRPLAFFPSQPALFLLLLLLPAVLFSITGVLLGGGRRKEIVSGSNGYKGEDRGFVGDEGEDNENNASRHKIFLGTNGKGRESEERELDGEFLNGTIAVHEVDGVEGVGEGGQIEEEGWGHKNNLEEGGLPRDFYMGEDEDDKHTVDEVEWQAEMVGEVERKEEGEEEKKREVEHTSEPDKSFVKGSEIGKRGEDENVQESDKSLDDKTEIEKKGEMRTEGKDRDIGRQNGRSDTLEDRRMNIISKKNHMYGYGLETIDENEVEPEVDEKSDFYRKGEVTRSWLDQFRNQVLQGGNGGQLNDGKLNGLESEEVKQRLEKWDKLKPIPTSEVEPKVSKQLTSENSLDRKKFLKEWKEKEEWPPDNELVREMESWNNLVSRNMEKFPQGGVGEGKVIMVLYVHNRPEFLKIVLESLAKVNGISETLLIVSHDGFYPEMDELVKNILFCQVKQIYAPYSPHNFQNSFPGLSPNDCLESANQTANCTGQADHFGHFRSPKFTSLKHHWWWMMNTVWDSLYETRGFNGHILFFEEDHFLLPNAYRTVQALVKLKNDLCQDCIGVNLAPSNVRVHTTSGTSTRIVAEKMGNIGYAFNRTVWEMIHDTTEDFCNFDDYNWDMTYWTAVQRNWGLNRLSLRSTRASAWHIGSYGLHAKRKGKLDPRKQLPVIKRVDLEPFIGENPTVMKIIPKVASASFVGYGGWGDWRDRELCQYFSRMYRGGY